MFELLTHEAVAFYLDDDEWTVNEVFANIPNFGNPRYSDALTELIKLCLMPEPLDRPSIEELQVKIEAKCQSIIDEYAASPGRHEHDRLYYKGSEINQMPPGNWSYWHPGVEYVPRPSEPPDSHEPRNPFTDPIIYPYFPTSEVDGPEEEGAEVQDGNEDDNNDEDQEEAPARPQVGRLEDLTVASDDSPRGFAGNNAHNPVIISDNDEEDGADETSESNEVNEGDRVDNGRAGNSTNESSQSHGSNGSNGSEDQKSSEGDSDDSGDSDVRRRMAIKKVPGT